MTAVAWVYMLVFTGLAVFAGVRFFFVEKVRWMIFYAVIFLTAKGGGEALAEGFESGAVMYINKPFTANKLLTIVKTMLESGTNL